MIAVLSGAGDRNFGDEWMAEALREELHLCSLVDIAHPETEARLKKLGLSGTRLFSGLVVSGGTLINAYFLHFLLGVLEDGLPTWTIGTGVGSPGFGIPERVAAPDGWALILPGFEEVTVRGPHSRARLAATGFGGALPVGDLALVHTPEAPVDTASSRELLVNVSGMEREIGSGEGLPEPEMLEAVGRAVLRLAETGWLPVPLVMHRDDIPCLEKLGKLAGGWARGPVVPRTGADARLAMSSAGAVVGMRLHASALGWIHGIPTLGLAYRDKTLDFAAQVGADDQIVDLRRISPAELEHSILALADRPLHEAHAVHEQALVGRTRLRSLMQRIRTFLAAENPP